MKWTYKFYNKQRRWASTLFIVFLSLMLKGSRINNIRFTNAVRPRNRKDEGLPGKEHKHFYPGSLVPEPWASIYFYEWWNNENNILDTLLDEKTGKYTAIIILKNIQYIELNNQMISYKKYINEINGWELVELNEIEGYKKSNIFNKQKPFAVMFEFFCQAKLYVVATEIEFNRI